MVHRKKEEIMTLQMTVPECFRDRGQCECESVIKVFVTSKPTPFTPFVLPKITISAETVDRPVRGDRDQPVRAPVRPGDTSPRCSRRISDEQWAT